jgi:Tol biopolymer transport system component
VGIVFVGAALGLYYFWPRPSVEAVHDGAPAWEPPDGRRIVFIAEQNDHSHIFVMNADGTGRQQLTSSSANESAPTFSPDGSRIAYDSDRDGNSEIYVMDASGQHQRRLTDHPAQDRSPAWSPDGQHIAFMSDRDFKPNSAIYVMDADGGNVTRVTGHGNAWAPQYSPDGKTIVAQIDQDIDLVDPAAGTEKRLTYDPDNGMSPSWSPDGRQLVFLSTRTHHLDLYVMNADGSNQTLLVSMSGASAIDPRWSPDGSRVAFVDVPDMKGVNAAGGQPYAIYVIEMATKKITRLSP